MSRIHPDDLPAIGAVLVNPPRRGPDESALVEYRITSPIDGELRWMRLNGTAYFNEQGALYYFTGTARDVTRTHGRHGPACNAPHLGLGPPAGRG